MSQTSAEIEKLQQDNRELRERITALEAGEARLDRTIATLSHDLKTPLTGIKLFADILLSDADEIDSASRDKYLAVLSSEAERMGRMISNIVDLQRLGSGKTEWHDEAHDIVRLVTTCAKPFQRLCAAKGIGFSCKNSAEKLVMTLDASRFMRLVSGLLANALRFTESGAVKIELRHDGEKVCLAVSDNGPGITEERLKALSQASTGATALGNDIGLTFARTVVDHYHGRIWAESVAGKGAIFYVELPQRREPSGIDPER